MSIATVTRIAPAPTSDFADRARFVRAGIVNVHRYANTTFDFPDGRFCLLGTNGSGKSRGMDMLLPFLLSGDRRRMGSSTSGTVTVESLMRKMIGSASNRVGYVWVECALAGGTHVTVGAYFKYSTWSTSLPRCEWEST
jgi:ABC-type multidrug transport system ATPase subunit